MKKYTGFTLTELLITLTIASIMLMLAVPSFKHFYQYLQTRYITASLTQAISYARLQAVLRYQTILITPKVKDNWQKGWIIQTKNTAHIMRDFPEMPLPLIFYSGHPEIQMLPDGTAEGYQSRFEYHNIYYNIKLYISRGGRIRVEINP